MRNYRITIIVENPDKEKLSIITELTEEQIKAASFPLFKFRSQLSFDELFTRIAEEWRI